MTTKSSKPVKILAHIYAMQKASREMSGGILHYASTHAHIQVKLYGPGTPWSRIEEFTAWKPDGIIIGTTNEKTIASIRRLGCCAAVFINSAGPEDCGFLHSSVYCDNCRVAEAAANLFRKKRLMHLAYVGTRAGEDWSIERGMHFCRLAEASCATFDSFTPPKAVQKNHSNEIAMMTKWLENLPKPCGIFASCDARAKDVLDAASDGGISIPDQLLVCGVDDEEFICKQMSPSLTSIIPDFHNGGYIAAETLDNLILSRRRKKSNSYFGVKGIVERLSTGDRHGVNRMVMRAQEFIRQNGIEKISVCDVAKASGASLRLLQKNFKTITGQTICYAIKSHRLEYAAEILRETATPIGRIGELCGFGNEKHLQKTFRQRFGCTMRQFRTKRETTTLNP